MTRFLDPRYIYRRRDRIFPWLGEQAHKALNTLGIAVTANDRRLAALHNVHKGQRAFIVATGPSLCISDLDSLKGEVCFGCNKIYLSFDQTDWRPTYYTVLDILVAENNRDDIARQDLLKIFSLPLKPLFPDDPSIIWMRGLPNPVWCGKVRFPFSHSALVGAYGGWTVIYTQLQLAYYMGIREVYLVGLDFSFVTPESTGEISMHGPVLKGSGEINHFHPNYRKPGERWTKPRLDYQYEAFLSAKRAFEMSGGMVYNASRQTALDVLPRVTLESVLGR